MGMHGVGGSRLGQLARINLDTLIIPLLTGYSHQYLPYVTTTIILRGVRCVWKYPPLVVHCCQNDDIGVGLYFGVAGQKCYTCLPS